ncbi:MAG TPA: helix-turn-helix domain-containing protein [Nocardioidaceae bacterium]|nr:helix-turn-helix domain-containing protein [Nocardioidaceae bacterium]
MVTTTVDDVPARRRLRGAERRQVIEDAAVEVFATRGYDAATLGEIAAAAGVTRTVMYDHFTSKRILYLHVLGTQNAAMLRSVAAGITGSGSARDRLRATVAAYLRFAADHPAARKLLVDPIPVGDEELDAVIRGYWDARVGAVSSMLGPDLERAGLSLDSPDVAVIVELLITGVDGVAQWWARNRHVPLEQAVDSASRLLWNGMPRMGVS